MTLFAQAISRTRVSPTEVTTDRDLGTDARPTARLADAFAELALVI